MTTTAPAPAPAPSRREAILQRYEQRSSTPLSYLAFLYLLLYTAQVIANVPQEAWWKVANAFGYVLWALFAFDLVFRYVMTTQRRGFLKRHWLQVITVAVPQLRPLLTLRAFSRNGVLSEGKGFFNGSAIFIGMVGTVIVLWVGSLAVLQFEQDAPNSQITNFWTAVWWALQTVTTVGYGDNIPVTFQGRIVATLVMLLGIAAVGVVSASLSATFLKQGGAGSSGSTAGTGSSTTDSTNSTDSTAGTAASPASDALMQEIAELKAMVAALSAKLDGHASS